MGSEPGRRFAFELLAQRAGVSLDCLSTRTSGQIELDKRRYPAVPNSYWDFVQRLGTGPVKDEYDICFFYDRLLDAASEYFLDQEVYRDGDHTPVLLFGHHSIGIAYGFRETAGSKVIRVDSDRVVEIMPIEFDEFVAGIFICYPYMPNAYHEGVWLTDTGQRFTS